MQYYLSRSLRLSAVMSLVLLSSSPAPAQTPGEFDVVEATIGDIHQAMRRGQITSRSLVEIYLERIETYDQPTRLNAIVTINPAALADADRLDEEFRKTGRLRPLHGIPVIVKDNYDTAGLQTTAGSLAMKGSKNCC